MLNQQISQIIAAELTVQPQQILAAIQLLDDGNTIPFIARYRKEATGGLDDTPNFVILKPRFKFYFT